MMRLLENLWNEDAGQGLVEYVLIIALVAIGLIAIITVFRNAIGRIFKVISDTLNAAPTGSYGT
jgi:Flp pilus assembly pilin Flp